MIHARKDYDHIQDPSGKIAADEPVFLLRAKDVLAPMCLILWAEELITRGGDKEMAGMVADHAAKMIDWQEKNGCKLPDLPGPLDELKAEVDKLSHFEMCKMWRSGNANPAYFDNTNPISKYFSDRLFGHFGGFTPEISKQIGW